MHEIEKLKQRLKNVNPNVTEYRMTVTEARNLVKEFEDLQTQLKVLQEKPPEVVVKEVVPITRTIVMDGGTF